FFAFLHTFCIRSLSFVSCLLIFFFSCYCDHRDLLSFPTRRSSDLTEPVARFGAKSDTGVLDRFLSPAGRRGERVGDLVRAIGPEDRKSTRLNSSHVKISYAVFCLKKKKKENNTKSRSARLVALLAA